MTKYFILFISLFYLILPSAFSQQQQSGETITITTYYPSPAGVYNELLVNNRMAVGDVNGDGTLDDLDLAHTVDASGNPVPTDGTLTIANSLGIGTNNPQGELHIRSTDNTNGNANIILEGKDPAHPNNSTGSWDIATLGGTQGTAPAGNLQFNSTNAAGTTTTTPVTIGQGAPNNSIFVASNGNVGIGTNNPQGKLDVNSTTGGLIPPSMTTAERDAINPPIAGMVIYNTDTGQLEIYSGGWKTVGGVGNVTEHELGPVCATNNIWIGKHKFCALSRVIAPWQVQSTQCKVYQTNIGWFIEGKVDPSVKKCSAATSGCAGGVCSIWCYAMCID